MNVVSWLLPGILVEVAILMLLWFRRIRRVRVFLIVPALMGLFSLLMFVMVVAAYAANGPLEIAPDSHAAFIGAFVGLLVLICIVARINPGYARTVFGEAARERDQRDPPRKRSLAVDLLGCAGLGILLMLMLGLLVAFGSSLGH